MNDRHISSVPTSHSFWSTFLVQRAPLRPKEMETSNYSLRVWWVLMSGKEVQASTAPPPALSEIAGVVAYPCHVRNEQAGEILRGSPGGR